MNSPQRNLHSIIIPLILTAMLFLMVSQALPFDEMRAVWIPAWCLSDKTTIDHILNDVQDCNFNTIFIEVRFRSDALYKPNRINNTYQNKEPISTFLENDISDFDPLEYIITQAKQHNISPHIWVTTYVATRKNADDEKLPFPSEWFTLNPAGRHKDPYGQAWLDPALPQVKEYLLNVFMDIIINYPLDGFHLDYIRYPGSKYGYNPTAIYLYKQETGLKPEDDPDGFDEWRCKQTEDLVRMLRTEMLNVKPDVVLSTAVFGNYYDATNEYFQDWVEWVDKGLVDFVVPMCYSSKTSTVKSQVDFAIDKVGMERLVVGLGILQRSKGYDNPDDFLERVKSVRSTYSSGLSFFSIETLRENEGVYLNMLRDDVFTDKVNPPDFLSMREGFREFEIVKFQRDDEKFYSIKYQTGLPHRYAYLLAKDLRDYTDDVFIFNDDASYTVYVGRDTDYTYIERLSRSLTFIR